MRAIRTAFPALLFTTVPALAEDPVLPDPNLTPGATQTMDTSLICEPGYTKSVRHTSSRLKHRIYQEYGLNPRAGHYEIDHLIPLELGGADAAANLWPQSYDTQPWNARLKDQLENFFHAEICAGRMPVEQAQQEISRDWIAAYRTYLGEPLSGSTAPRRRH